MTLGTEALPDHWEGEDVIITIEEEGMDTVLNFEGTILKWNKGGGEEPTNDVYAFGSKTFNYSEPRKKTNISFDVVLRNADWDRVQYGGTSAASAGLTTEIRSTAASLRKRIIIWCAPKANHHSNGSVVVPPKGGAIYREIYTDVKSVTLDKEFDAGEYKKGTITLELSSSDSDGYANIFSQFTPAQGTTTLTVLTATAHKGILTWNTTTPAWTGSYRT